jgi:cobalt-zinc-cadmium efflux system protein
MAESRPISGRAPAMVRRRRDKRDAFGMAGDQREHGQGGHVHAAQNFGAAFAIGATLNVGFIAVEIIYGLLSNSVALLSDAGHNFGDALGLLVAWGASVLARRPPSARFTYGLRASSILAALFNAVFLLVTVGALSWEAIQRLGQPQAVAGRTVTIVAAAGVAINGATALLFASGRRRDINLRGAFMHMASDALVSAGVVVAGLATMLSGWLWLDPLASLAINAVIVWGTWGLLRESLRMSLAAVPLSIDLREVRHFFEKQRGVASIHDLHVWPISTTEVALTCHLVMPSGHPGDEFLHRLSQELAESFNIHHATMQIEIDQSAACALAPDHVV